MSFSYEQLASAIEQLRQERDTLAVRVLDEDVRREFRRILTLRRQLFGSYLLTLSTPQELVVGIYGDEWEFGASQYATPAPGGFPDPLAGGLTGPAAAKRHAERAFEEWDGQGEPRGWTRHRPTGRRRPNGDPGQQFIRR